jgi:hypothetical protein
MFMLAERVRGLLRKAVAMRLCTWLAYHPYLLPPPPPLP